ncbi:MAG: hypothetical protein ACI4O9_07310 [Akkermansia sp.]
MNHPLCLLTIGLSVLALNSCITAAVTAAAGTAGSVGGLGGALSVGKLLSSDAAPETLEGCSLKLSGTSCSRLDFPRGVETNMLYTRQDEHSAVISISSEEGSEHYYLTFTSAKGGSVSYEQRGADGSLRTEHGTFTLE